MTEPRLLGGRYELGQAIGIGGMAEVFRGRDVRLGRDVAVKVLRADLAREPSFQGRFRREAQAAAGLNAPCIVSVFDTGESDGVPYIVMEYVEGRTLRDVLQSEGRLLPQRALEIVADVCAALDVAHAAGIVHRDIKPGNVMLTPRGEVKVMDFGIARAAADTSTATQTAAVMGTAAYLSPEQARGENVDSRSDIYSTGCMLYELVTGAPPFTGDSPVAVAYQHVREEPTPPSAYDESLPPAVDAVVLKAMAKRPVQRYQSADEMREDLLRAAAGVPVLAVPYVPEPEPEFVASTVSTITPRRRANRPVLIIFGLVLLAVVIGVAALVRNLLGDDAGLIQTPRVVGLSQQEATLRLAEDNLQVGDVIQQFAERPPGTVIGQSPDSGFLIGRGGTVELTVSKGIEMTVVPQVIGLSQGEAEAELTDAKLTINKVVLRDVNLPEGQVLDVLPRPGSQVRARATVDLVVSSGKVQVPDLRGKTKDEAIAALQMLGFAVGLQPMDSTAPVDTVIDQRPVNQLAPRGSTVVIVLAQEPQPSPSPSPTPASSPPPPPPPDPTPSPQPSPTPT